MSALVAQRWHVWHPLPALHCVPAIVLILVTGLAMGQPGGALVAAGGAFSVGFGGFQRLSRWRLAPMVLAAVGMAISTAIGTVASNAPIVDALCVAASAVVMGLGTGLGTGAWWVMLQGFVFLVLAGSIPGDLREGLSRALLILVGGAVQCACVMGLRALAPGKFAHLVPPNAVDPPGSWSEWRAAVTRVLKPSEPEFGYALLLGVAAGVAAYLARKIALPNGYWAPMTVLLVLRRGTRETLTRGALRMIGTLVGAGAATLAMVWLKPSQEVLVVLAAVVAWGAYSVQWVNYGTFSTCVTAYVVFLFAFEGLPETVVIRHRIAATLIGGAIALAALGVSRIPRLVRPAATP
ncbi:MAG TPA: FUSC family protein [Caulobacteraceae bacterium]